MTAIDISRYQGVVDFQAVKGGGVGVVIAKMGGGDAGVYVDARWVANRDGIRAAGLKLGSYYFNGPGDTPTQAADFHFANADWHPGDMLIIDVEGGTIAWSVSEVIEWVNQILTHGVPASSIGVYMSASVVRNYNWGPVAALGTFLWVASYGANTGTPGTPPAILHWDSWALWQYTSNGSIPGIPGRVDVSQLAPGWSGGNVTPLENTMPAYTLLAVNEGALVNTWIYVGLPQSFVLSGDPNNNQAEKQTIAAINGVDVATLEANVVRVSTIAGQIAIGHIPTATVQTAPAPAPAAAPVDLSSVTSRLDTIEGTLAKGYTFNVKPAA